MSYGQSNLFTTLGAGVGSWGQALQNAYENRKSREMEQAKFDETVRQFNTQTTQAALDRELRERALNETISSNADQRLLSGIVEGEDGRRTFDPTQTSAFRTEVASRDAGLGSYNPVDLDYKRALTNRANMPPAGSGDPFLPIIGRSIAGALDPINSGYGQERYPTDEEVQTRLHQIGRLFGPLGYDFNFPEYVSPEEQTRRQFLENLLAPQDRRLGEEVPGMNVPGIHRK